MKYNTLLNIANALTKEEINAFLKMEVAFSVDNNMDTSPYDEEGFEELCSRVHNAYLQSDRADLDLFCYLIQNLIDSGEYDGPTEECLADALDQAEHNC